MGLADETLPRSDKHPAQGLAVPRGRLRDVVTGRLQTVPAVDVWACGFECDSVSGLDMSAERGCVARASNKTGRTASGCLQYIRRWRPSVFVLENVKNLNAAASAARRSGGAGQPAESAATDLDVLRAELERCG